MRETIKSRAEEKFLATQKKVENVKWEKDQEQTRMLERTRNLRSLRMIKEAAEKKAAAEK